MIHAPKLADGDNPQSEALMLLQHDYYELVKEYSNRKLTYGSDKFPAFSGLARLMKPAFGDGEYIAGVWSNDLYRGLCWYDEMGTCEHYVGEYRAPSWSWAITNDRIVWAWSSTDARILANGRYNIKLLDFTRLNWAGDDSYGRLFGASLVVRGYTMSFYKSRQIIGSMFPTGGCAYAMYDELDPWQQKGQNKGPVYQVEDKAGEIFLVYVNDIQSIFTT
jgi:hypothetical protein